MLGAQLAPWRLWCSGLGRNGFARAASLDSARTRSQGLRGLKKTVTDWQSWILRSYVCSKAVAIEDTILLPPRVCELGQDAKVALFSY
jgi:hypothetical protein